VAVKYTTVARIYEHDPMVGSVTDITSAVIADVFIADAEAEVDSALGRFYTLPISVAGVTFPLLTAISTDLTLYALLSQRIFTQEQLKDSTWPDRFKEARTLLDQLASGARLLIDSSGQLLADRADIAEVWSNTMDYVPTMSELDPEYSSIDSEKSEDLSSDRNAGLDFIS
jgi:phage gp36-like protein